MKDERIDLEPLAEWRREVREDRVIRGVMRELSAKPSPRTDMIAAILLLGRPAVAVAMVLALGTLVTTVRPAEQAAGAVTIGGALGMPPSAERAIRGDRDLGAGEMLAILGEMQ